jgi:hypothetical protein
MKQSRWNLAAVCGVLAALAIAPSVASATASMSLPGSGYAWAQPGTAPVIVPSAQPPAWVLSAPSIAATYATTAYVWAQPGTAPVVVVSAQPTGSIPTG